MPRKKFKTLGEFIAFFGQGELAAALLVHPSTVSKWANGHTKPLPATASTIVTLSLGGLSLEAIYPPKKGR